MVLKVVDKIREDEPRVGTRKLHDRLGKAGLQVGRDRLFGLLSNSLRIVKPKKSFRKTTYSNHSYAVAPNRLKGMSVTKPAQVLVSDMTYLELYGGKFAYLFLITDQYSRKILGYHLSRDMSHYSALLALDKAIEQLPDTVGVVHHSDRGCQYCCHEYLGVLREYDMLPSMTDADHCAQNALAERVNGILKGDFNLDQRFPTFEIAAAAVTKTIEVYNTKRTHWSLGLRTPQEVFLMAA